MRGAPQLIMSAALVGGRQIQNTGTVVGNVVNASPAGDSIPALRILGARLHIRSARRRRQVDVAEFITGPGRTVLTTGEMVTHIEVPVTTPHQQGQFFDRVGTRRAQAITKASIAFRAGFTAGRLGDVRIAMGAVGPTVLGAPATAEFLTQGPPTRARILEAGRFLASEAKPIDDVRSTARYRRSVLGGLLARNLLPLAVDKE